MRYPNEYDKCTINEFDNVDLVNVILKRITQQEEITEEDRRVITHLNECLFQMNLKKQNQKKRKNENKW